MALRLGYCYLKANVWNKRLNAIYLFLLFMGKIRGKGKSSLHYS